MKTIYYVVPVLDGDSESWSEVVEASNVWLHREDAEDECRFWNEDPDPEFVYRIEEVEVSDEEFQVIVDRKYGGEFPPARETYEKVGN
jgi:hypothetical protein